MISPEQRRPDLAWRPQAAVGGAFALSARAGGAGGLLFGGGAGVGDRCSHVSRGWAWLRRWLSAWLPRAAPGASGVRSSDTASVADPGRGVREYGACGSLGGKVFGVPELVGPAWNDDLR